MIKHKQPNIGSKHKGPHGSQNVRATQLNSDVSSGEAVPPYHNLEMFSKIRDTK